MMKKETRRETIVDDNPDALLGGFGLRSSLKGPFTILETEEEPDTNDPIFQGR